MIHNNSPTQKGIIEGTSRVIRELLRSPKVKQSLRVLLRDLDAENTPLLIQSLTQSDPELSFAALSALPNFINAAIEAGLEIMAEAGNVTPALREEFIAQTMQDIDAEKLGRLFGEIIVLKSELLSSESQSLKEAGQSFYQDFTAGLSTSIRDSRKRSEIADALADTVLRGARAAVEKVGEDIANEHSLSLRVVERLKIGMTDIATNNPEVVASIAAPLAQAWRDILATHSDDNDKTPGVGE